MAVITTVGSQSDARDLAHKLVGHGLAACAQISNIESIYRWEGKIAQETEWRLVLKTTSERLDALQSGLKAAHPYEVPQILTLKIDQANAAYVQWVEQACSGND